MASKLSCWCNTNTADAVIPPPGIDYDYPRPETRAMRDTSDTYLGKYSTSTTKQQQSTPDQSGFHLLGDATNALAVRLLTARKAERCIDSQYYLIKNDVVGRTFMYTLLQAADRGVRVRLLLDDMFTQGYDAGMLALSEQHDNFEIRVFNPFHRSEILAGQKAGAANLADFERIQRRMHNKSFTVDNQITVLGGRNIADEYFGCNLKGNFHDDDVMAIGPIVQEVSDSFDEYWNHSTALPVGAFVKTNLLTYREIELGDIREEYATSFKNQAETRYAGAIRAKITDYLYSDSDWFQWAPYQLVVDSPNKGLAELAEGDDDAIATPLFKSLQASTKSCVVVSPYFVPDEKGIQIFIQLQQKGVEVIIVTNSLAANNMFMVHGGYGPVRKPLLEAGIKIYEVRPDSIVWGSEYVNGDDGGKDCPKKKLPPSVTTLHTKEFIVDDREVFIGSFNFDPRSIHLNTECGVIIHDPKLGEEMTTSIKEALPTHAYEVFLNKQGRLRWRTMVDGKVHIEANEPQTTFLQRTLGVVARAVPKSQL